MTLWADYDWPLIPLVALAAWYAVWAIRLERRKLARMKMRVAFFAENSGGYSSFEWELWRGFYARKALEIHLARGVNGYVGRELHSVRVPEAVQ